MPEFLSWDELRENHVQWLSRQPALIPGADIARWQALVWHFRPGRDMKQAIPLGMRGSPHAMLDAMPCGGSLPRGPKAGP